MTVILTVQVVLLFLGTALSQEQGLSERYQFSRQLHDRYTLYWTYDPTAEEVSFAVSVQTTGWIGFGLSPTGQMPGSDVVIGWVDDNGDSYFDDRFASERATPPIDEQQNWYLTSSMEDNGYTTLEFKRDYVSCDTDYDLDIEDNTARVVWSFKEEDPPNGADGTFIAHDFKGSASVNLLGGLLDRPDVPDDTEYFDILADNVAIPAVDTTYWCSSFILPENVRSQEKYIIRVSPNVAEESAAHVHHLLVYLCTNVSNPNPSGTSCSAAPNDVNECLSNGQLITAWAVGGEDFIFPENVALPIGGPSDSYRYVVMQTHYNNPDEISGVVDNSGMRFYYSSTPREHNAGIMQIGHQVVLDMIIPPKLSNYTILTPCPSECTQYLPDGGIKAFANMLHTHLLGVGVELLHLREQENCTGVRELKPIDQNLRYDFNYQNTVHFDEVLVKQGDILMLKCIYDSTNRDTITLGGESTNDEMCLSFMFYYPAVGITKCVTRYLDGSPLITFVENYVPENQQLPFTSFIDGYDAEELHSAFDPLDWTSTQTRGFQELILASERKTFCQFTEEYAIEIGANHKHGPYNVIHKDPVNVTCPYTEKRTEKDCSVGTTDTDGATTHLVHVGVIVLMALLATTV